MPGSPQALLPNRSPINRLAAAMVLGGGSACWLAFFGNVLGLRVATTFGITPVIAGILVCGLWFVFRL